MNVERSKNNDWDRLYLKTDFLIPVFRPFDNFQKFGRWLLEPLLEIVFDLLLFTEIIRKLKFHI